MVSRGVKRHVSPSRADQLPADLYGRRRLWRVVTPLDGSEAAAAAVTVHGFAGLPGSTSPQRDDEGEEDLFRTADDEMKPEEQGEQAQAQEEQEDERGGGARAGGGEAASGTDAGWAPTHLGPIFFGP